MMRRARKLSETFGHKRSSKLRSISKIEDMVVMAALWPGTTPLVNFRQLSGSC